MKNLHDSLKEWLPEVGRRLDGAGAGAHLEYVGRVIAIGDGIATISGLPFAKLGEVLRLEDDSLGLVFRVGASDAPMLAHQLGDVAPADLIGLGNHECFAKIMCEGRQSKAFTAFTRLPE